MKLLTALSFSRALYASLLCLIFVSSMVRPCAAESWQTTLAPQPHLPALFLAVDKSIQRTFLIRTTATPALDKEKLLCTTGQRDGDKMREGDLKTPEGVYFIEKKINSGLDFTQYGNTAFPLNYPNPIDRIRGKTGYGIWIHGRGTPLDPKLTRGCVALQNPVVDTLDQHITLHQTPVVIAQQLTWSNATHETSAEILHKTWTWITARERGEDRLFSLYDPQYMAKSTGKSFAHVTEAVRAEYMASSWTDIRTSPIRILEGPGYMVSFFSQTTNTATTSTQGWRRLYWLQRDKQWKIAGEEWIAPRSVPHEDYVRTVEQEIQALVHENAFFVNATGQKTMRTPGADASHNSSEAVPYGQGSDAVRQPVGPQVQVVLTTQGVEARISSINATEQTHVFLPGKFDSWTLQPGTQQ